MDRIELPDIQKSSRVSPYFNFKQKRTSGKHVLKVEALAKSYGEQPILNKVNFSIGRGEKVVVIGANGIGKSTLLNRIDPTYQRDQKEVSMRINRGKHTTREVVLLPFNDGYLVDTPGFSELELKLSAFELKHTFNEFANMQCKFSTCLHLEGTLGCKLDLNTSSNLVKSRFTSFMKLLEMVKEEKQNFKYGTQKGKKQIYNRKASEK
jgi:ribosome small subunit-dependent GTPase A